MKHVVTTLLATTIALGTASSAFAFSVDATLNPTVPQVGKQDVNLKIADGTKPTADVKVNVVALMPATPDMAEMQSTAKMTTEKPGMFSGRVNLSMSGVWYLNVVVTRKSKSETFLYKLETGKPGLTKVTTIPTAVPTGSSVTPHSNAPAASEHQHHH